MSTPPDLTATLTDGAPVVGAKYDDGKDPWDLLPFEAVREVVRVLEFGARKYSPENWRAVPNGKRRYFAAALRHLVAWKLGETKDHETGLHPLAHAVTCLLFILALEGDE